VLVLVLVLSCVLLLAPLGESAGVRKKYRENIAITSREQIG
jgi:hypothetical protein